MATLSIWETVRSSHHPVIRLDERTNYQTFSFTTTAGQSAAFDEDTGIITVVADAACAIRVGADPTAIATDYPLAAGTAFDIEVRPGDKISAIAFV